MDVRLRPRVLLALLSGLFVWLVWGEVRRASEELDAALQVQERSARENTQAAQARERRERLRRVSERLAGRVPPPTSAREVRQFLVRAAGRQAAELSQLRLQPVVRPPEGTLGAEAGITALGEPASLSRFLAAIEGNGWPIRTERATLAVRGGLGTLTARVLVLWPDPAAPFSVAEAGRLADDPRLERLTAWLEAVPRSEAPASLAAEQPVETEPVFEVDPGAEALIEQPPETAAPPAPAAETPELHGFVDVGSGTPIRAALFYRGETTLVGVGDRIGDYTVVTLEPSEAVVLSSAEGPPLRLILR